MWGDFIVNSVNMFSFVVLRVVIDNSACYLGCH